MGGWGNDSEKKYKLKLFDVYVVAVFVVVVVVKLSSWNSMSKFNRAAGGYVYERTLLRYILCLSKIGFSLNFAYLRLNMLHFIIPKFVFIHFFLEFSYKLKHNTKHIYNK